MTSVIFVALLITSSSFATGLCPNNCSCNDETYEVVCHSGANLDVVPIALNPAIQRLDLKSNRIKTVDSAFQFYRDLQYVDLSNNHLVNIPPKSFSNQIRLQELHLNSNKLSSINNSTFEGLASLTVLNLRGNFIEELPARLFYYLPKLEELNIGQNNIVLIDTFAFDGLKMLKILYIDKNALHHVPSPSFAHCNNLVELHIGLNTFSIILDDAFSNLTKLTLLDIRSVALSNISSNAFRGLNNLKTLNLVDNHLKTVPTNQIHHLTRLEELYIGQNYFEYLNRQSFIGLPNLRKLDVSGTPNLTRIAKGVFMENLNLETIIIADSKNLEILDEGAFLGLPNLHHLNLRDNGLREVPESLVSWENLRTLELSNNPIVCDCDLLWLSRLLTIKNWNTVQCSQPSVLKGRSLRDVTADELGCSFQDPRQQAILLSLGISAVILLGGLGLLLFRYRQRVGEALKDYKWNKRAINRKEHEYQKTYSDDEFIVRTARHCLKPIPVTEL